VRLSTAAKVTDRRGSADTVPCAINPQHAPDDAPWRACGLWRLAWSKKYHLTSRCLRSSFAKAEASSVKVSPHGNVTSRGLPARTVSETCPLSVCPPAAPRRKLIHGPPSIQQHKKVEREEDARYSKVESGRVMNLRTASPASRTASREREGDESPHGKSSIPHGKSSAGLN
jgi:hypothetical protein